MKVQLICKKENEKKIRNLLFEHNIEIKDNADLIITEKEYIDFKRDSILGKKEDTYELIELEDIIYIESLNTETFIRNRKGKYKIKDKLYELEKKLEGTQFLRVSKSFIINIKMVETIKPSYNLRFELNMKNGDKVYVTRSYYQAFKEYIGL